MIIKLEKYIKRATENCHENMETWWLPHLIIIIIWKKYITIIQMFFSSISKIRVIKIPHLETNFASHSSSHRNRKKPDAFLSTLPFFSLTEQNKSTSAFFENIFSAFYCCLYLRETATDKENNSRNRNIMRLLVKETSFHVFWATISLVEQFFL